MGAETSFEACPIRAASQEKDPSSCELREELQAM